MPTFTQTFDITDYERFCLAGFRGVPMGALRDLDRSSLELIAAREVAATFLNAGRYELGEHVIVADTFYHLPDGDTLIAQRDLSTLLQDELKRVRHSFYTYTRPIDLTDMSDDSEIDDLYRRSSDDPDIARATGILRVPKDALKADIPADKLMENTVWRFLFDDQAEPLYEALAKMAGSRIRIQIPDGRYEGDKHATVAFGDIQLSRHGCIISDQKYIHQPRDPFTGRPIGPYGIYEAPPRITLVGIKRMREAPRTNIYR